MSVAARRGVVVFCWVFAGAGVVYGVWHDVIGLQLTPHEVLGHTRLVSRATLPPIATIATNILILPLGLALWRRAGISAFFLGSLFILVLNGATGSQPWGFIAGNGAEVIFIACLLVTESSVQRKPVTQGGACNDNVSR